MNEPLTEEELMRIHLSKTHDLRDVRRLVAEVRRLQTKELEYRRAHDRLVESAQALTRLLEAERIIVAAERAKLADAVRAEREACAKDVYDTLRETLTPGFMHLADVARRAVLTRGEKPA